MVDNEEEEEEEGDEERSEKDAPGGGSVRRSLSSFHFCSFVLSSF
jgi:hypothetical protein